VALDELLQGLGHQAYGQGRATAEVQFAGVELGHCNTSLFNWAAPCTRRRACCSTTWPSGWGQGFAGAVDQWAAEGVFEVLDGPAEGGLGDAHGLGGANETAVFGEGNEVAQLAEVHVSALGRGSGLGSSGYI
jgi:hypothetical protein